MVISAMLNLLADSGIVPSWSSASALLRKAKLAYARCPHNHLAQIAQILSFESSTEHDDLAD
eukprot:2458147-Amphidinium_carterae.1